MIDLILPYLFGTIATAVVLFLSTFNYMRGKTERLAYEKERALLPDAVRLENLQELRRQSEAEYDAIQERLTNARIMISERDDAEKWLELNRDKLLQMKSDREDQEAIRRNIETLKEQQCEMAHNMAESHSALSAIRVELNYFEKIKSQKDTELAAIEEQKDKLLVQLTGIESQLSPLQIRLASIQANIDSRQEELSRISEVMERRIEQYEQQIAQNEKLLEKSEKSLANSREQLDEVTRQLHAVKEERARVSADVQALQREKVALEDLIKNLRADWNTVLRLSGQDEGADERRTQELWIPYISKRASEFESINKADELKQLERTDKYLQAMRLYFPKRVLYAFHTSLKVTDISPLVVLAGISGTGKSELPRRYAEAMGLHFLNVAVQPRWDSPQDMFGFFNYLENRYRATELGRALVQMDPYHNEEGRGWATPENWGNSLSSQMMLILLDEMNLARVEYYFSEFLSRLETRRGVNRKDAQSRRKAEIGLEVGAGKNTAPIMQLFVDQNVLFVGTMNEDETTQALSDKVIDRANVLRFGRPGTIENVAIPKSRIDIEQRLRFEDWRAWCQGPDSLPQEVVERVNGYVSRLDNAMSKIKRPFGFRTRNGILSYVANYPSKDVDSVDSAVADQIEQKIIPKFRGLDPRDHEVRDAITDVRGILSDLGDQLLVDALDQTIRESQFVWLGVNRFLEQFPAT